MVNRAKQLGTSWETAIVNRLREEPFAYDVERLRQSGKDDQGDIVVKNGVGGLSIIEAKNVAKIDLAGFVGQAILERDNYCKPRGIDPAQVLPLAVIKRRARGVDEAFVVTTLREFFI